MKTTHYQKGFGVVEILLIIVIIGLIGFVGWYVFQATQKSQSALDSAANTETIVQQPNSERTLTKGTFGDEGDFGTFEAEGYVTTAKVNEAFCEQDCTQYDYAFFKIAKIENAKVIPFLKAMSGNSYAKDDAIGLGCVASSVLSYSNASDANGMKEYTVSSADTSTILGATPEKPVVLAFEKPKLSGGSGAPTCYSHFTFELVK